MAEGGEHASQQLGADEIDQRYPVDGERRRERVASRFERGEAEAEGGTENHPGARRPADQMTRAHREGRELHRFLDEPDTEEHQR